MKRVNRDATFCGAAPPVLLPLASARQRAGTGTITELSTGFPGYDSIWGKDMAARSSA